MTTQARKLLIIFGTLLVLSAFFLLKTSDEDPLMSGDSGNDLNAETTQETEGVLSNIQRIQDLALDTRLFSDDNFKSLRDFTVHIADVRTGRTNPFEPVVD